MDTMIQIDHVGISFKDTKALKDVSFTIQKGEIFGFLGPSGAGKTTTIKLLTKQLRADHGEMLMFGKRIQELSDEELYQNIGILSDNSGLYEKFSVYENLRIFAEIQRVPLARVDEVLKKTALYECRKKKVKDLSKGMKQRLLFSRAIINAPKVLFLDEPTSSLDPATSEAVHQMMLELNRSGTTIFLTTHNMVEADKLCDRVAFLHHGEIVEMGNPDELKLKYAENEVDILTMDRHTYTSTKDVASLIAVLKQMEADQILRIASKEPDLKTIFLKLTGREL